MNVNKVKEALILARDYINDGSLLPQDMDHPYFKTSDAIDQALAELKKPDKEAYAKTIAAQYACTQFDLGVLTQQIERYAESYHAKKCAECVKIEQRYCDNCDNLKDADSTFSPCFTCGDYTNWRPIK